MAKKKSASRKNKATDTAANLGFEAKLWQAADKVLDGTLLTLVDALNTAVAS